MAFLSRGVLATLFLAWMTVLGLAADRAIIVLDASGSMWGQIDGRPKVDIARETLRTVLQSVPADMELGLMAYGHREKGSCADIELVVPPAAGSAPAITSAADTMKFLGKTPLTAAVRQAAEALKYTEEKSTVILITDGIETCEADPCALGRELESAGVDFTAHVVGFGLTAEEGREVACLAENTGGRYLQASDAAGLADALTATVVAPPVEAAPEPAPAPEPPPVVAEPAPEPAKPEFNFTPSLVMAAGGAPLGDEGQAWEISKAKADGSAGDYVATEYGLYKGSLEPGDYVVRARLGEARTDQALKIEAGQVYAPVFDLNAGTLVVRPRPSEGADVDNGATVFVDFPGEGDGTYYGQTEMVLPAGEQKLVVRIGKGEVSETFALAAGQTVEKDIVVGVGQVTTNALYAEGGEKADSSAMFVRILRAAKKIDGSREEVAYSYGADQNFSLSTGDYVARIELDKAAAEQPFNIRAGETKNVTAVLNAGVLVITAPGAKDIKVFAAKKNIQGDAPGVRLWLRRRAPDDAAGRRLHRRDRPPRRQSGQGNACFGQGRRARRTEHSVGLPVAIG